MRTGSKRMLGLALAAALALSACTGDDGDADQPEDTEVSIPPVESSDSGDGSGDGDGNGGALDLDSMTDDELLAEAERTYLGLLEELETVRDSESGDYMQLEEWVTDHFRTVVTDLMSEHLPAGYRARGTADLVWIQLSQDHDASGSEVFANVCLDNTPIRVFDESDVDVTNPEANEVSTATVKFILNEDETRLLVDWERRLEESETRECSLV